MGIQSGSESLQHMKKIINSHTYTVEYKISSFKIEQKSIKKVA